MEMDGEEEHLNEVPSMMGSEAEAENSRSQNLGSDSLDEEENKLEGQKSCQTAEECDNSLPETTLVEEEGLQVGFGLTETVVISEEVRGAVNADENGCLSLKDESPKGSIGIKRRGI